jgi:hypothetical protein
MTEVVSEELMLEREDFRGATREADELLVELTDVVEVEGRLGGNLILVLRGVGADLDGISSSSSTIESTLRKEGLLPLALDAGAVEESDWSPFPKARAGGRRLPRSFSFLYT